MSVTKVSAMNDALINQSQKNDTGAPPDREALMQHVYTLVAEIGQGRMRTLHEVRGLSYALGAAIAISHQGNEVVREQGLRAAYSEMRKACNEIVKVLDARDAGENRKSLGQVTPTRPARRNERDHAPRSR